MWPYNVSIQFILRLHDISGFPMTTFDCNYKVKIFKQCGFNLILAEVNFIHDPPGRYSIDVRICIVLVGTKNYSETF